MTRAAIRLSAQFDDVGGDPAAVNEARIEAAVADLEAMSGGDRAQVAEQAC